MDNCPEFSIGGIKTGSTIEEVNKTFGVNYTNECRTLTVRSQNGAFTDSKGTFTLTVVFTFSDGIVYNVGESKYIRRSSDRQYCVSLYCFCAK